MNSLTCQKVFIIRGGVCHNDSPLERIKNLFAFVQETSPQRDEKRGPVKPIQSDGIRSSWHGRQSGYISLLWELFSIGLTKLFLCMPLYWTNFIKAHTVCKIQTIPIKDAFAMYWFGLDICQWRAKFITYTTSSPLFQIQEHKFRAM